MKHFDWSKNDIIHILPNGTQTRIVPQIKDQVSELRRNNPQKGTSVATRELAAASFLHSVTPCLRPKEHHKYLPEDQYLLGVDPEDLATASKDRQQVWQAELKDRRCKTCHHTIQPTSRMQA